MATRTSRRTKSAQKRKSVPEVQPCIEIPPLAHLHYRGDRHLHPQRLPSAKREIPVSLRLLDTLPYTITNVSKIGQYLKRLTISELRLTVVPVELLNGLTSLERLDLSYNRLHDASLPEDFRGMENLLELTLNNNKITQIPTCVKKMKNLSRLDLSHNKIDSLKGLEKLKRLQVLVVENNMLTSVVKDLIHLRKLETFCCSHNNIREIQSDIRHMRTLKEINLSHNKVTIVMPEIFFLPKLEVLDVSNNKIAKIQSFTVKLLSRHWIQNVDLSDNLIARFPEHLLLIVKKLDLSGNKIKQLVSNVLKKMDWKSDQDLIMDNNPLTYPSIEVCTSGLKTIVQFFQEVKAESPVHQGLKVIVLGARGSGKSSLVQSLVDQQSRTEDGGQSSCGIDCYDTGMEHSEGTDGETSLNLSLWDFGGHPDYLYPFNLFVEYPSVALVTFKMSSYNKEGFHALIGSWFDWMISLNNKMVTVVVGTQADLLPPAEMEETKKEIERAIQKYLRTRKKLFESEMKKIESRPHISATYSEQLKNYMNLLKATLRVYPRVIITSSSKYTGFTDLHNAIKSLAQDTELFPNFNREIPTFWVDVEHFLEDKGNFMAIPVMSWADYEEVITRKFGMKHVLISITQYLHDTGKVLWFSKMNFLKDFVFLRPSWLFEVFRNVFRYDINTESGCPVESLKKVGLSPMRIERGTKELSDEGIVEKDFLKGMLNGCVPHDLNQPFLHVLSLLLEGFGIGYPVQSKMKEGAYNFTLEPDAEGKVKIARVLLPWYRKRTEPITVIEQWKSLSESPKVVTVYNFHQYMPPGLFEAFTVRVNSPGKYKLQLLNHWEGGIHAQHRSQAVQLRVTKTQDHNSNFLFTVDVRCTKTEGDVTRLLWEVLLPILMIVEDLLQTFHGCWVNRQVHCPLCNTASFTGEWLTPKETQGFSVKPCENCEQVVDTGFLVPPKEKKRDDVRNRVAQMKAARSQQTSEEDAVSNSKNIPLTKAELCNGGVQR